jgi:kinesin family protein 4/21/27
MARKESAHREQVESLQAKLAGKERLPATVSPDCILGFLGALPDPPSFRMGQEQSDHPATPVLSAFSTSEVPHRIGHDRLEKLEASLEQLEEDLSLARRERAFADQAFRSTEAALQAEGETSRKHLVAAEEQQKNLMDLRSSLRQLLQDRLVHLASVEDGAVLDALGRFLAEEAAQRASAETKLQQLETAAQQLAESKRLVEQLSIEKIEKECAIKALEQRIQELANAKQVKIPPCEGEENLVPPTPAHLSLSRSTTPSLGYKYPPPITPPPALPPPPVPESSPGPSAVHPSSRCPSLVDKHRSDIRSSTSSGTLDPRFPLGGSSVGHGDTAITAGQLHAQIEEQETMICTLNKQLLHCETDLQAASG